MCLAVPAKIIQIDGVMAVVEIDGVKREANLTFVPEAELGNYVLIHAGFAIQIWDESGVQEFNDIMSEISTAEGDES